MFTVKLFFPKIAPLMR